MIEIMGLPGSGKSYILNCLEIKKGLKKINEDAVYDECKNISKISKLCYFFYTIVTFFDVFLLSTIYILLFNGQKAKRLKQLKNCFKYLVLFNCVIRKEKNDNLIVLDQGILQFIWSIDLITDSDFLYNKYTCYIFSRFAKKYDITAIYYKVDYSIAANQAVKRNKKSEFDYMDIDKLSNLYKKHFYDYEIMSKYLNDRFLIIHSIEELTDILSAIRKKHS